MTQQSNIDKKAIAIIAGFTIAGLLIGTFVIAPIAMKNKAKKKEEKKKAVVAKKG